MLLADHAGRGAILATALPDRTAGDVAAVVAGTIARTDNRDYENYVNIIDNAAYNEAGLNGFVGEIAAKIALTRGNAAKVNA